MAKKRSQINRIEVVDWSSVSKDGSAKTFVKWEDQPFNLMYDIQDKGRTLKIFIDDNPHPLLKNLSLLLRENYENSKIKQKSKK